MTLFRGDEDHEQMERRPAGGAGGATAWLIGSVALAVLLGLAAKALRLAGVLP